MSHFLKLFPALFFFAGSYCMVGSFDAHNHDHIISVVFFWASFVCFLIGGLLL